MLLGASDIMVKSYWYDETLGGSFGMREYVAFDIEIVKSLPDDVDNWKTYRPLGISCAATLTSGDELTVWYGRTAAGGIAERMNRADLAALLVYLEAAVETGFTLLTWNGLGFDLDILAEESGASGACKALALDHVDMMFHIFCELGYPLGLDRAAKGMDLPGKPPGMSGEMAPILWAQGKRQDVLDYVAQDARTTLLLAQAAERNRHLRWLSKRGRAQTMPLPKGWLTVQEALTLPEPDTSWMRRPWPRKRFTEWIDKGPSEAIP
jgi:hypothetical protein